MMSEVEVAVWLDLVMIFFMVVIKRTWCSLSDPRICISIFCRKPEKCHKSWSRLWNAATRCKFELVAKSSKCDHVNMGWACAAVRTLEWVVNSFWGRVPQPYSFVDWWGWGGKERMVPCEQRGSACTAPFAWLAGMRTSSSCKWSVHVVCCSRKWGCTCTYSPATSAARFRKAQGPLLGSGLGVGNPCFMGSIKWSLSKDCL